MQTAYFNDIRKNILAEIKKAKIEIKAAIGWFTNYEIFDALCTKVKTGVSVELIVLDDYINNREDGLDFQHFINIGGRFYFGHNDRPMHNKCCIIDKTVLINGSYNWTYFAESKNEENIIIHSENEKLIEAFISNFERIKGGLQKVETIIKNAIIEIDDSNLFSTYNYLAQDYLYRAISTNSPAIIEKAFNLSPTNIYIQKKAVEFKLKMKRKTISAIGQDVIDDGVRLLVPEGTQTPANGQENFTTTADNQIATNVTIRYGNQEKGSLNKLVGSFKISGIPAMKKGEPKLVTKWKIDLFGILTVTKLIKETNNSVTMQYDINHLLVDA